MDFLGTYLHKVKICTRETQEVKIQMLFRKFNKMAIVILVCIYVSNIGVSYAEAKERQNLNASGMFRHIQT